MITVGIDEVGRGCWAGPLVAGAVILDKAVLGIRDSKQLSPKQRQKFAAVIGLEASAFGLGWVWPPEIDELGITASVRLAMRRALDCIAVPYGRIIIDGNINFLADIPAAEAVIKADNTVPAVSAASIIAKVARDKYMSVSAAKEYPGYGFEKHVGYGTKMHIHALDKLGVTNIHRKTYKPIQRLVLKSNT